MRHIIQTKTVLFSTLKLTLLLMLTSCLQIGQSVHDEKALDSAKHIEPIQALYITNYSSFWHDYDEQQKLIRRGVSRHVNVEFSLVGKDPDDALKLMSQPEFSAAYDVVIYNMCFADPADRDSSRIDNIIAQTRDLGVPAVLLHCAMHSFGGSEAWWRFTGVRTKSHDWARPLTAKRIGGAHPVTAQLPEAIHSKKEELYRNLDVVEGVTPLYVAHSPESDRDHLVAWTHQVGGGRVFATTLGHGPKTLGLDGYHQLVAKGIAHVTGRLRQDGHVAAGYEGNEIVDNFQGTVTCKPSDVIEAATIPQVQAAVRRAVSEQKHLKVISLDKSNSDNDFICPKQGGLLLNVWQMDKVKELDRENLTVTVQPGIRSVDLSRYLHGEGFAIRSMPDFTGVSIAGGIATAAHHSSLNIESSMADMVLSMKLVDGEGNLRVFEGKEVAKVATHLGMLGAIVEVTLRIEPQFKLAYGHEKGTDEQLESIIEAKVREHDYARVMWFAGNGRYVLDYYDRVSNDTPGTSAHNIWSSTGGVFNVVGDIPYKVLNNAPLRAQCDSALLRSKVWLPPLKVENSDCDMPVGWSHEMLGSYCEPGSCPWDKESVRSRTMEASFALSRLAEWMTDVRFILAENRACFPILGIYLRFSKSSDRWMGFNYGQDTVAFEIHVPKVANETGFERSSHVYDEIMQMTLGKYNGRPHWGKNSAPEFVGVGQSQYPRYDDFVALKRQLDPAGRFDNKIFERMNGKSTIEGYPGCALSRDCICSSDSDCGDGYRCMPGGHYTQARVCRK